MTEETKEEAALKEALGNIRKAESDLAEAREEERRAEAREDQAEAALHEAVDELNRVEHEEPREAEIIVNGRKRTVPGDVVSFEELVKIAYPDGPTKPNVKYTITYRNAAQVPPVGELNVGGKVKVKIKGHGETSFNVTETVKS